METQHQHLWTRDGHLTALTLDRYQFEELSASERELVQAHLEGCAACRERQQQTQSFDQALALPALRLPEASNDTPTPVELAEPETQTGQSARILPFSRGKMVAGTLLAAAAAALFVLYVQPAPPEGAGDGIQLKGRDLPMQRLTLKAQDFSWEVFVNDDQGTRKVTSGSTVYPGQRLGFQIHPKRSGHLLIVGVDDQGQDYLCYPQRQQGNSTLVAASANPYSLEEAMRLDDVVGHERLLAIFCLEPVTLGSIKPTLIKAAAGETEVFPTLRPGCLQSEITLKKEPAPK